MIGLFARKNWALLGVLLGTLGWWESGALSATPEPQPAQRAPNILLVIADDLGVDMLASYGSGSDLPVTPTLDSLAASGTSFRNAWSNPNCSPTRCTLLTGRYALRTGVGNVISKTTAAMPLAEVTLPELLDQGASGYAHAAFGKWHLGNASVGGLLAPNLAGFGHFDGGLIGALEQEPLSYFYWPQVVDGQIAVNTGYNTSEIVDAASAWIQAAPEPWFCYLSFYAPHAPLHEPPAGLYTEDLNGLDPSVDSRPFYKAMIEAMDAELGRLMSEIGSIRENTNVIFVGDNGTPPNLVIPPFDPRQAKGTVYQGGVLVPLIMSGPSVEIPGSESLALVNTTDLFTTLAEMAGVDAAEVLPGRVLDSISVLPFLRDPSLASLRDFQFAELFSPVGATGNSIRRYSRAISDGRYKLITNSPNAGLDSAAEESWRLAAEGSLNKLPLAEFYDLQLDPLETTDLLLVGLTAQQQAAFDALQENLLALTRPTTRNEPH